MDKCCREGCVLWIVLLGGLQFRGYSFWVGVVFVFDDDIIYLWVFVGKLDYIYFLKLVIRFIIVLIGKQKYCIKLELFEYS